MIGIVNTFQQHRITKNYDHRRGAGGEEAPIFGGSRTDVQEGGLLERKLNLVVVCAREY